MAEIDTRPLDSVQAAVTHFDGRSDQLNGFSPDKNEDQIATLTKEQACCKLQLEVRESEHKQATLKIETLQSAVKELCDRYEKDCMDAHIRIAQLEAENITVMSQQLETATECRALREELAAVRVELDAARASVAYVLREVEAMETRAILEREGTKDALARILRLNETVLSSAVAAIRAEEERSVFFQEAALELFSSDRNSEAVRRQAETLERMERELLAKTVEVEYLRSELQQTRERYASPQEEASDATAVASGCTNNLDADHVLVREACETAAEDREAEAEFTFPRSPEQSFVPEMFRKDFHAVPPSDGNKMEIVMSEDVVEDKQGADSADVIVRDVTVTEGKSDALERTRWLVDEISGEDRNGVPSDHEEAKADVSFVLESSRDDFQSVHSDAKDVSIAGTGDVAVRGNQEPVREAAAAAPISTPLEGDPDARVVATEIVPEDGDEFYTKELEPEPGRGQGSKLDGYVLVAKRGGGVAERDKQLDAARTEISDLRFSLEEAVRRAELAEEAKAALERELREELRRKPTPSRRRRAASDTEDAGRPAREWPPQTPARPTPTPTPSRALRSARPGGEDMLTPRCLTLGKVLNMKYK